MEQLLAIMSEIRPDIDFETENELIDADILDSFDTSGICITNSKITKR